MQFLHSEHEDSLSSPILGSTSAFSEDGAVVTFSQRYENKRHGDNFAQQLQRRRFLFISKLTKRSLLLATRLANFCSQLKLLLFPLSSIISQIAISLPNGLSRGLFFSLLSSALLLCLRIVFLLWRVPLLVLLSAYSSSSPSSTSRRRSLLLSVAGRMCVKLFFFYLCTVEWNLCICLH